MVVPAWYRYIVRLETIHFYACECSYSGFLQAVMFCTNELCLWSREDDIPVQVWQSFLKLYFK